MLLAPALLSWYDKSYRTFSWRALPGHKPIPYYVWLSEIMLQQTTTATVERYFNQFSVNWEDFQELANANLDDILHVWQGLGYYARARNIHKCAKEIVQNYNGQLPSSPDELVKLPGIGPYTSAAIAAIAFDIPVAPVDGNIERVFSRLFQINETKPQLNKTVQKFATEHLAHNRPGDYAQALMDLGATICTPTHPKCLLCPLKNMCTAFQNNVAKEYPKRAPKTERPVKNGIVFYLQDKHGKILLEKRPTKGLLGGMIGFPTTPWTQESWSMEKATEYAPASVEWTIQDITVTHVFTHFSLHLKVAHGIIDKSDEGLWAHPKNFHQYAFPTLMKKIIRAQLT
jgi:A/G-specific adenine glycosylase